jgi:quercetin dioxygenase-like cupin family protein
MFTGDVRIDSIAHGQETWRARVGAAHFAPSARTAWHSHGGWQTLYVVEGTGLVRSRGDSHY